MPDEKIWEGFFDIDLILSEMEIDQQISNLVEIGSGFGTFTIPSAKRISGTLFAFDIESDMIELLNNKILTNQLKNIITEQRDILIKTTGLLSTSIDYLMLFNILHHHKPDDFFNEAYRILKTGGKVGIIHWRSDIPTPRGPHLSIRPDPDQIIKWVDNKKFTILKAPFLLKPYHYGFLLEKA